MKNLSQVWNRVRFGVFVTILAVALLYLRYGQQEFTQTLALRGNDIMQSLAVTTPAAQVALVEITDLDTATEGQWPWARRRLAQLVEKLRDSGASLILFTDVFADPDLAKTDQDFARVLDQNGVILARSVTPDRVLNPVPQLSQTAAALGFVDTHPDPDGVVRRMSLTTVNNDQIYYSIGVETLRVLVGDVKPSLQLTGSHQLVGVTGLQPWRQHLEQLWRIKYNRDFVTVRATDSAAFKQLQNRIVIVGVATESLNNWVQTPVGPRRSHWVQAAFLQSLFERNSVVTPPWADMLEMLISILIIASILKAAKANTPYACIPVYLGGMAVVILGSWMLFNTLGLAVDWVWPTLSSTSVFVLTFYYHWARKRQTEWRISQKFGDSVSSSVLSELKKHPQSLDTSGEARELSVIYADLRGFATLASHYQNNPQGLTQLIHQYMDRVLPCVTNRNGTIDKLIGDGVVAFWNAPVTQADHAMRSVSAALDMLDAVSALNRAMPQDHPVLTLDVGVNTGDVVVGNTGSRRKFNYTCLGESARAADGLESLCKDYRVNLLIGESTAAKIGEHFTPIELDSIALESGTSMKIYTILEAEQLLVFQSEAHNRMLESFYAGRYDAAIKQCRELKTGTVLSDYYTSMLRRARQRKSQENTEE